MKHDAFTMYFKLSLFTMQVIGWKSKTIKGPFLYHHENDRVKLAGAK